MLLQELIDEYILLFRRGELTSSQQRELIDWLNADATHQAYYRKMLKLYACIEMTEEDLAYSEMYREAFSEDALRQAYGDIYGAPLEMPQGSENDVTSIQPNVDYKDENGDNICGATTLYSL